MLADRVRTSGRKSEVFLFLYNRGIGEEDWEHFPNQSSTVGGGTFTEHVYNDTFLQILTNFPSIMSFNTGFYTVLDMTDYNYIYVELEAFPAHEILVRGNSKLTEYPSGNDILVYEYVSGKLTLTADISEVIGDMYLIIQSDLGGYMDPTELRIYKVWVE